MPPEARLPLPGHWDIFQANCLYRRVSQAHMLLPRAGRWAENSPSWKIRVCISTQLLQNNRLVEKKQKGPLREQQAILPGVLPTCPISQLQKL